MLQFICNPVAGKGKSLSCRHTLESLLKKRNIPHCFHDTEGPGDAARIASRLTAEAQDEIDLIAMGGDGTLNEVLNGLEAPSRVRLGIIPCGSGNDFAAVAGIPGQPEVALDVILKGQARPTDYLECGGVRGINAIGAGIDVEILRRYNRMKLLKGSAAYLASLVVTLFSYRASVLREITDEGVRRHNALIACASNGQRFGGGIPICPRAVIDDGLMDIVIVDDIPRPGIPGAFVKLLKKQILDLPTTSYHRASRLCIESDTPLPIQIDGEIHENLPFDVRLVSGVLRVYRP